MEDRRESFSAFSSNSASSFSSSERHALSKCWLATKEVISSVQPSLSSEQRRKDVVNNIRNLIGYHFGNEVFRFGSVPLKTYIPDGDIDLTVVSNRNVEDLARDICTMLEREGQRNTEFQVKNLRFIHAQVKIVKCTVQNIAVDISFNQMAGLSALYFLELVDQLIGKDHLFKQSLILIKAWCYYESRILGAHHGLISTYALETLVLYIINFCHSSLNGPLAVLYKFLAYFSTFEWDKYCVSLNGPVPISSLPEVLAEKSKKDGEENLLNEEFLRTCKVFLLGPTRVLDGGEHEFPIKHLNIIDPLKDDNNLGRSVSKGNFYRIKCALTYGAQKLEEILTLPGESMSEELKKFFATTLDRNGRSQRPDVQVPVSVFGAEKVEISDLSGDSDTSVEFLQYIQWCLSNSLHPSPPPLASQFSNNSRDALGRVMQFNRNLFLQRNTCIFAPGEPSYYPNKQLSAGYGVNEMFSLGRSTNFRDMGAAALEANLENIQSISTCVPNICTEERAKPLGSACDSPDTIHHSFGDMYLQSSGQKSKSSSDGILQKAPEDGDRLEVPLETDKKGKSLHNPRIQQPFPSQNHAGQTNLKPSQAKKSSPLDNQGFGSPVYPPSPSIQNSELPHETLPLRHYKLEDVDDFPPLSIRLDASKKKLPRLQDEISKKGHER